MDSEKYGVGNGGGFDAYYQTIDVMNSVGALRSNDFGITNATSHTYTLTVRQESSINFKVYQWNGSTTVRIGGNFNANSSTTPVTETITNFTPLVSLSACYTTLH